SLASLALGFVNAEIGDAAWPAGFRFAAGHCGIKRKAPDLMLATAAMAVSAARLLRCPVEDVMVCSTGVIGRPLPVEKILAALPAWMQKDDGALAAAQAILTTDTCAKLAAAKFRDGGREYRVAGFAKGSGMIHPRMATMLGFLFTDAPLTPRACE